MEIACRLVLQSGDPPQEANCLAADGKQQRGRDAGIGLDRELPDVFGENRRGRPNFLAVIDEPRLDVFGRVVVDDDVDGDTLGDSVRGANGITGESHR